MKIRLFLSPIWFILCDFVSADYPPLTPKDNAAIKMFRPEVEDILPHDWMKEDWYLLRWIKTKKYDLEGAKELLEKNIQWRNKNNIDNLTYDPMSNYAKVFPSVWPGVDNEGRPVVISDWSNDFRKVVVTGKRKEFSAYLATNIEIVERKMRELNSTQWIGIYDINTFSTRTHLCVQCLPLYLDYAVIEESYYPLSLKECIIINAPRIFQSVLRLVAPVIGDTINRITTLGVNKAEWTRYILERIPADQIPVKYGGTQ